MGAASSVVVLSGGVGGARFAAGVAQVVPPEELVVVVNVGDDFRHLGLAISPDLDTVMYTLAGMADEERGWGRAGETWQCMDTLASLGAPGWFRLGDRDLAVHLWRTERLRAGDTLSTITADLASALGVRCALYPVTDDVVSTQVETDVGTLDFQDYFVRQRCEPRVTGVRYAGAEAAALAPSLARRLRDTAPRAVLVGPSNPYLSIEPMLAIAGLASWLRACEAPVVAVSPIVGGNAVKGPAAKMMRELGAEPGPAAVIARYASFLDGMLVDVRDGTPPEAIAGCPVRATDTLMRTAADRARVAMAALDLAEDLARRPVPERESAAKRAARRGAR